MKEIFTLISEIVADDKSLREIVACNEQLNFFGLSVTKEDAELLVSQRAKILANFGRIELSGGVIPQLMKAFSDSSYLSQDNFVMVLAELIELFYYFKNEFMDEISDDELIELMYELFEEPCFGDVELLNGMLERKSQNFRYGNKDDEAFRQIFAEIRECRYASDKISIIKASIKSLVDLKDLLAAECLFDDEYNRLFQTFGDVELALLMKAGKFDMNECTGIPWKIKLKEYLTQIEVEHNRKIIEIFRDFR